MSSAAKAKSTAPLLCKWSGCDAYEQATVFVSVEELARHVRTTHVDPFESQDVVVCQWEKCKVYNVPSSSIQWLRRHVQQAHTKDRPFKCIMNGCIMSFNSREALQRHVNRHLEPSVTSASSTASCSPHRQSYTKKASGSKMPQGKQTPSSSSLPSYSPLQLPSTDSPSPPLLEIPSDSSYESSEENNYRKKSGCKKQLCLKIRIPRRSISLSPLLLQSPTPYNGARIHTDVWDHKMMSVIRQTCNKLTQDSIASKSLCVNLKASILGQRRCTEAMEDELLVRWSPRLADDCWTPVSQFKPHKSIPFSQLSEPYLSHLVSDCFVFSKTRGSRTRRKA